MPLGDEVASATLSAGQKSIEITAELIKMLAPLLKKAGEKLLENILFTSGGKVAHTALVATAASTGSRLSGTGNILSADVQSFVDKAKAYNIPVSVVGSGDKQTLEFLECDKGIIQQITQEIMQERLQGAPQSIKSFNVSENSVSAMKALFEQNGIDCQFCKTSDGQIKCVYPAEMEAQAEIIKEDYKQLHSEVSDNLTVQKSENEITISDEKLGKSFSFSNENKAQTMEILREEFGYSNAKAELAANKICRDLGLDKEKFFADTRQYDNLNSLKTNIRYPSDDITLRDMRFNSVNFKDGGINHIVISNGDKTAALTPEKMTDTEMRKICTNNLEMNPQQAEKAIEKSKKINNQIMSKLEERTVDRDGISQTLNIKRTADNTFNVSMGDKSHTYNFSTIGVEENVARHFGIPMQNAKNVVDKAKKQSVLQNKINDAAKKKKTANMPTPKLNESKGLKR